MKTVTRCAQCGASLECLASEACWCMKQPAVLPVPAAGETVGCLCPACLDAAAKGDLSSSGS
ncbi:hypothetical protein [Acetobacter estunensis]|uniref:hypothetical protein n=1 Tax=Acetobacter estunensis TaxID=104097 RepID=UPI001C2CF768|nr:hypothetical protein [Acetobacter estunensis]MBV1836972.1 hypothetical protein [Acetobacter estunensis]